MSKKKTKKEHYQKDNIEIQKHESGSLEVTIHYANMTEAYEAAKDALDNRIKSFFMHQFLQRIEKEIEAGEVVTAQQYYERLLEKASDNGVYFFE